MSGHAVEQLTKSLDVIASRSLISVLNSLKPSESSALKTREGLTEHYIWVVVKLTEVPTHMFCPVNKFSRALVSIKSLSVDPSVPLRSVHQFLFFFKSGLVNSVGLTKIRIGSRV